MDEVVIGEGDLAGKGVYAAREFKAGEVVVKYSLIPLTQDDFDALPPEEQMFTHSQRGQIHLYSEPERYVNDSDDPNTYQDFEIGADVATRDIAKGEAITTNANLDDVE